MADPGVSRGTAVGGSERAYETDIETASNGLTARAGLMTLSRDATIEPLPLELPATASACRVGDISRGCTAAATGFAWIAMLVQLSRDIGTAVLRGTAPRSPAGGRFAFEPASGASFTGFAPAVADSGPSAERSACKPSANCDVPCASDETEFSVAKAPPTNDEGMYRAPIVTSLEAAICMHSRNADSMPNNQASGLESCHRFGFGSESGIEDEASVLPGSRLSARGRWPAPVTAHSRPFR